MSFHPVDALDAQLDLIRWYQTDEAIDYVLQNGPDKEEDIETGEATDEEGGLTPFWERQYLGHRGDWMIQNGSWLDKAETYAVTPDMQALLAAAAHSAPEEPLRASDIPARRGFLYFGNHTFPLPMEAKARHAIWPFPQAEKGWGEGSGQQIFYVAALSWNQTDQGLTYAVYIDARPFDAFLKAANRNNSFSGRLQLFDVRTWDYDLDWFYDREDYDDPGGYGAEKRHAKALEEYAAVNGLTMDEVMKGACDGAEVFYRRMLLSFFRLVFQRVSVPRREFMGRGAARRAERGGMAAPDLGTITVIKLRREYGQVHAEEDHDPSTVDWSHRWMVSGHWRNQWYPSLGRHQAKYIPAYIKGPQDKPFIAKDRIWSLER